MSPARKPTKARAKRPAARSPRKKPAPSRERELEKRLTEALEQQAATSEILRVIRQSPSDPQPAFDTIAERAARLCESYDAAIFRRDGDRLLLVAHHGSIPLGTIGEFSIPARGTMVGHAVLDGRTVHVTDAQARGDEFAVAREYAQQLGYRTTLAIPLMREGVAIGTIGLRRREVKRFTDRQVALVETLADQAVIALENARLFRELEARNGALTESLEQQTATSEILRVISSSPTDVEPVFAAVAASAARLCDAFDAAIHRIDGDVLRLVAHEGPIVPDAILPLGEGTFAGHVVRERRAMHVADIQAEADTYPVSSEFARHRGFRTILGAPLLRGVRVRAICLSGFRWKSYPARSANPKVRPSALRCLP